MSSDPEAAAPSEASVRTFRGSLDELARRYYAPLLSFFRKRTHNASEVQDLVQQVFLRLAQYEQLEGVRNPDGYIFQTAANTLRDHYRHNAVRDRFAGEHCLGESQQVAFTPERVLEGREAMANLAQALRLLPERTRDILMLRCFEGLKHTEIARLQGISVRSVEKHMAKALGLLTEALGSDSAAGRDAQLGRDARVDRERGE